MGRECAEPESTDPSCSYKIIPLLQNCFVLLCSLHPL